MHQICENDEAQKTFAPEFLCMTSNPVQVDQDVDEPWPLEVYGHDGTATNVTMEPGKTLVSNYKKTTRFLFLLYDTHCVSFYLWFVNVKCSGEMVLYESHSVIHGR